MLNYPNINSPANIDASVFYLFRINSKMTQKLIIKKSEGLPKKRWNDNCYLILFIENIFCVKIEIDNF